MTAIDLDAIRARIRDCATYNFGMWSADKLAHEDAPALLAEIDRLLALVPEPPSDDEIC